MAKLDDIIKNIKVKAKLGIENPDIEQITVDSRNAGQNVLFVAKRGEKADGHNFIANAIERGSQVIVCEEVPIENYPDVIFVQVENSTEALAEISNVFYDYPSQKLKLVGVTGTNGKTTIATLSYQLARLLGYKAGLCSTIANYINDDRYETINTTPDSLTLNKLLHQMVNEGCDYCFIEVSSHAVVQQRIAGLHFAGGIFTNLTHDHLDYHKTFDEYLKAKKGFFDSLDKQAFAVTNLDDKNGGVMVQNCKATIKTYSVREFADFNVRVIETLPEGMLLRIGENEVWTGLTGQFNASNLAAIYATAVMLKWQPEEILLKLSKLRPAAGRFEVIHSKSGYIAIVDYAHTPDALKNVTETAAKLLQKGGKMIVVCGCGGNRDPFKRPVMAAEALKNADLAIFTSDNPRYESPEEIINQMLTGVAAEDLPRVLSIVNRKEAIRTACMMAKRNDIVLIAGKGHENYQEINGVKHHFDDCEIVNEIFENQLFNL